MDSFSLHCICKELNEKIINTRINKIYQPDNETFTIHLSNKQTVVISLKRDFSALFMFNEKLYNPSTPSAFCMLLRKFLTGGIITDITSVKFYRIAEFTLKKGEKNFFLLLNFSGKQSNLYLLNSERTILANLNHFPFPEIEEIEKLNIEKFKEALEKNSIKGFPPFIIKKLFEIYINHNIEKSYRLYEHLYEYNFSCNPVTEGNKIIPDLEGKGKKIFNNFSEPFSKLFKKYLIENLKKEAKKTILKKIKKNQRTLEKINKEIKEKSNYSQFFKYGELLKANIYKIKKGMKNITVNDFYNENFPEINIQLEPEKTPQENIEKYFKLGKKYKRGVDKLKDRINELKAELLYFEECLYFIENSTIYEELLEYLPAEFKNNKKIIKEKRTEFQKISYQGISILIGKSSRGNDYILRKFGKHDFLWLHVKDFPGSHVIILEKYDKISEDILYFAAKKALENSKAKNNLQGEVIYTPVKYVKKVKGSPPGMVTLKQFKTIFVKL